MKFEEAIKINGKATLDDNGYVQWDDENNLVDNNGNKQILNKDYFESTDWEPFKEQPRGLHQQMRDDFDLTRIGVYNRSWHRKNIEKCRELIKRDIDEKVADVGAHTLFHKIIDDRFGEYNE